ncbi:unnamed protein product [Eruca vesicaria subsp. sativa]|uniref:Uncharacterized protein n=1 Tax=Eruca vesicaria subsp. sativa TaxID=29727 RepID=A0ABC8LVD3_ERUVS|nr:unnamed protein product [Eruca vesicaria subsp. sativa]
MPAPVNVNRLDTFQPRLKTFTIKRLNTIIDFSQKIWQWLKTIKIQLKICFQMVDKVYDKSQKIIPKPYVPRDELPTRFSENSYGCGSRRFYTMKRGLVLLLLAESLISIQLNQL